MNRQIQAGRQKTTMVLALPTPTEKVKIDGAAPMQKKPAQQGPRAGFGSRVRKVAWLGVFLAVLGTGAFFLYQNASESAEVLSHSQVPVREVNVAVPERASTAEIILPATIQAYQATDLFARANGFLKAWHFDIGAPVKMGQVLAEIETPELEQELAQSVALLKQGQAEHQQAIAELEEAKAEVALAEANVVKAKANVDFAISQAKRYETLVNSQTVAREEYETAVRERDARNADLQSTKAELARRKANLSTRQAIIESREAIVGNREANVQRLRELTGFQKVVAPFDGIVTRRTAEVGMLVSAGSNSGTHPLFSVAQVDILRVQAAVPQSSAMGIKPGDQAHVTIPEKPGQVLIAKVARTAGAVDPTSRSLLVEVELPNPETLLLPGLYAQIRFQSRQEQASWVVQAKALLMRSNGPHVAIVTSDGTLRTQKVGLGRDFGAAVEVLVGLNGGERLVVNPSEDLRDGQVVQVVGSNDSRVQVVRK
jgi:RND family efflux transporter MFP subunit